MTRVRTPRFVFALAVLLVALQFMGVIASGRRQRLRPGALEVVHDRGRRRPRRRVRYCRDAGRIADPNCLPAGRDRQRSTAPPRGATRSPAPKVPGGTGPPHCLCRSCTPTTTPTPPPTRSRNTSKSTRRPVVACRPLASGVGGPVIPPNNSARHRGVQPRGRGQPARTLPTRPTTAVSHDGWCRARSGRAAMCRGRATSGGRTSGPEWARPGSGEAADRGHREEPARRRRSGEH